MCVKPGSCQQLPLWPPEHWEGRGESRRGGKVTLPTGCHPQLSIAQHGIIRWIVERSLVVGCWMQVASEWVSSSQLIQYSCSASAQSVIAALYSRDIYPGLLISGVNKTNEEPGLLLSMGWAVAFVCLLYKLHKLERCELFWWSCRNLEWLLQHNESG